jgi:hypothetical protein
VSHNQLLGIDMSIFEETTFSVPRFLSFIDLGYLYEAAKVTDEHFSSKISAISNSDSLNEIGNINATRQSLLRAVFISSYSILEQSLDELMLMEQKKNDVVISPNDLKHRGVNRSITYANKVLGKNIDTSKTHWKELQNLQEVRNHLVHYGAEFSGTSEHQKRFDKFLNSKFVTLRPVICFTISQIELVIQLYMDCVKDFSDGEESKA